MGVDDALATALGPLDAGLAQDGGAAGAAVAQQAAASAGGVGAGGGAGAPPWTARTAGGWEDSPTQTGGGAMAAGRGESLEPDVLALILSPSSSDEEPD